ncbi:cation:proton antiporter [uncultured Jatrophihabitans sp.]|uniref:cation:proton antiporter domain-containing protein n=1 Tax=uncultured Jatrophihabitans sp. TaxID=1610747 RepID=UPI0035CB0772
MGDLGHFAIVVLLVAITLLVAIGSHRLTQWLRIPAPALFLIAAAVAAELAPSLSGLSIVADQRIVTVALAVILFDGGMSIGWSRMREAAGAVVWVGFAGTLVTAAAMAVAAHYLFGFDWRAGLLVGAALAPTDPAVVFSVLGGREIAGRSDTVLEGESGANDPVGIALMVSLLGAGGSGWSAVGSGVGNFAVQLAVGGAVGLIGGWLSLQLMRRAPLPNEALYPVQTIAFALALYGGATALEGSGFLAVFLAGIVVGDVRAPHKREIERFTGALAGVAEIVAFVVLGLSVQLSSVLSHGRVWTGLGLAAVLILVARPALVGALLLAIDLRAGERWFVLLSGLKGAVPILLGTYVLVEGAHRAEEIYDVIFVVVLVSVLVQGSLVPTFARVFKVPMRPADP